MFTTLTNRTSSNSKAPQSPAASARRSRLVPRPGLLFLSSARAGQPTRARLFRAPLAAPALLLFLAAAAQRSPAQPPPGPYYATQDIPVLGTVTNDYSYTLVSDDPYESITETQVGHGNPQDRYNALEHKWTIEVSTPYTGYVFYVEGYHPANSEPEHFVFAYSSDDQMTCPHFTN